MIRTILLLLLLSPIVEAKEPIPEQPLEEYPQFDDFIDQHDYNYDNKYVIVNRASQQLVVINNTKTILSMRVIVGRNGWRTPLAETSVTHVITNPYWNVPKSIKPEMIAKIKNDYKKYQRLGYRVYYQDKVYDAIYAMYLPPKDIKIKQLPGKWNALGIVKFKLKDIGNIFMHDTPVKSKFNRTNRRLSHGCVRLQEPLQFLTAISPIVYKESVKPQWYKLTETIPVYIVDWTKSKDK